METKICPLLTIANAVNGLNGFCREEECAWWDRQDEWCAILSIDVELSNRLSEINEALRDNP